MEGFFPGINFANEDAGVIVALGAGEILSGQSRAGLALRASRASGASRTSRALFTGTGCQNERSGNQNANEQQHFLDRHFFILLRI
jgi:hypothetical protein